MKILAVSDIESKKLWDYFKKEYLEGVDLILAAGDLSPEYLSFLVTMGHAPVLYVPGNHDRRYLQKPPEGCINIDNQIYTYKGIRIMGLGGSMRYNNSVYQYTENEMRLRVLRMGLKLTVNKGFDILLTHAPAKGFHDGEDLPHRGFEIFNGLINHYEPLYHVHGHVHKDYGRDFVREDDRGKTKVINAYEYFYFECEQGDK